MNANERMKEYSKHCDKMLETLIDEDLTEISSEDYISERDIRKLVNL